MPRRTNCSMPYWTPGTTWKPAPASWRGSARHGTGWRRRIRCGISTEPGRRISSVYSDQECEWSNLVDLVQGTQISTSQVVADPETGNANHVIQDRLASGYEAPCLG